MDTTVQVKLVENLPAIIAAVTALVGAIVSAIVLIRQGGQRKMLQEVKDTTNGHLSEQREKVKRAELLMPGVTEVPPGSEVTATLSINDPSTTDPPVVIEKKTQRSQ